MALHHYSIILPPPLTNPPTKKFLPAHSIQPIRRGGGRAGTTVPHHHQQHSNNDAQSNHCGHCFTCKWTVHVCVYTLQVLKTDNWIDTFHHSPYNYKRFSFTLGPSMKLKENFLRFCTEGPWFTLEIHAQCSQKKGRPPNHPRSQLQHFLLLTATLPIMVKACTYRLQVPSYLVAEPPIRGPVACDTSKQ